jgi:DNA-binding transcriptional regulator GbsR (MarR family)
MALKEELAKIDKRNGVKKHHLVADEGLLHYVDTQITEMKQIIARDRVDVLLNEQIKVEGKQERDGRDAKVRELEARIIQMVEAVDVLTRLADELTA